MNIGYFAFIISQFGYQCVKVAVHRMLLTAFPVKFCYITSVSMHLTEFLHHLCLWEVIRIKSSFCYCERIIPQPRPTLCDTVAYSPPGCPLHGILQARILECIAIPSSRESSQPGDRTRVFCVSCIGKWVLYH